jgi:hypothetical protein
MSSDPSAPRQPSRVSRGIDYKDHTFGGASQAPFGMDSFAVPRE